MGAITSRQNVGVEEVDVVSHHAYRYPPRSGNYFGTHFIMGGERFDTPQPESYLFGENTDLNYLGSRPTPFPYPPPQPSEPTKTLKSLVNIRKESLRFVRAPSDVLKPRINCGVGDADIELGKNIRFNIEFTFDCDVQCSITIYYLCVEDISPSGVVRYIPRDPKTTSEPFHYKKGANQQFCQIMLVFDPTIYNEDELIYDMDREVIPLAIHCVADASSEGVEDFKQSHTTYASVEKMSDGTYVLKAIKQKLFVDGLCYLLQEIYGIENKNNEKCNNDDDAEDNGSECVICMCDVRDTLILPCRHLCLCNSCADSLRYQANNCPICRAPFRALLQIRALQKSVGVSLPPINPLEGNSENIPPGYEAVSLIEALNGPCLPRPSAAAMPDLVETPENESQSAIQAAQVLNTQSKASNKNKENNFSEFGMQVLQSARSNPNDAVTAADTKWPLLSDTANAANSVGKGKYKVDLNHEERSDKDETHDDDSEAEKLSPLLQNESVHSNKSEKSRIDDAGSDGELSFKQRLNTGYSNNKSKDGEESDYYTPDEVTPAETIYGPGSNLSSVETTPNRLPSTPLSHASARSSQDSYSSGSSTKQLLTVINNIPNSAQIQSNFTDKTTKV